MDVEDPRPDPAALPAGVEIISLADERYPPLLRLIHDPPQWLYVRGDAAVLGQPLLAVVGSRKASPAAVRLTQALCGQAVAAGLQVCSGLALGIDAAAHRGALHAGGRSVAVMATGIDRIYPSRHRSLASELAGSGCLVTELPPGTPPLRHNFPRRNRIISGLSLGVLVVEAALPSGSLITAGAALEQGREVFALPWSVLHAGGAGCLQLLRDGARMVQGIDDVLDELGPLLQLQQTLSGSLRDAVGDPARRVSPVLDLVGFEAVSADELVRASGMPVADLMDELAALELQGLVVRCAGGYIRA